MGNAKDTKAIAGTNIINCVLITDENYAMPASVTMTSLRANKNPNTVCRFTVIGVELSPETKDKFLSLKKKGFEVNVLDIDKAPEPINQENLLKSLPASTSAMLKFDLPEILADKDKVLYLDCDLIIKKDLTEFFNTDLGDNLAAVVFDECSLPKELNVLKDKYFNSGVMLLNLSRMRVENISKRLKEYRKTGFNKFMDQDTFNMVFKDRVLYMPFENNMLLSVISRCSFERIKKVYGINPDTTKKEYIENSSILHLSGSWKPWKYDVEYWSDVFKKYYNLSPYKNNQLILEKPIYFREPAEKEPILVNTEIIKTPIPEYNGDEPKISVIIPIYNAEKYLNLCLDSVIYQPIVEMEIICVDDGSTDGSIKILKEYQKLDKRIKVLTQKNSGAGAARNFGVENAHGKYLYFFDSDDFLEPNSLYNALVLAEQQPADIHVFRHRRFDDETYAVIKVSEQVPGNLFVQKGSIKYFQIEKVLGGPVNVEVVPWNKLFSADFFRSVNVRFDTTLFGNDRTAHYYSMLSARKIIMFDLMLVNKRANREGALTGDIRWKQFQNHFLVYKNTIERCSGFGEEVIGRLSGASINEIFAFFTKAPGDVKEKIFKQILDFFQENNFSVYEKYLKESPQYLKYSLINSQGYILEKGRKNIVPVVFAASNTYVPYLAVALTSLIQHADKNKFYDIYVFHSELTSNNINRLESFAANNIGVKTVNVKPLIGKINFHTKYPKERNYQILIPELLYIYDKVVYLDCDILVMDDVAKLLSYDLKDNIVGAIRDFVNYSDRKYVLNELNLYPRNYFNSGVLVLNNEALIKEKIKNICIGRSMRKREYYRSEQDLFNVACAGKVSYIGQEWNWQWHHNDMVTETSESISDEDMEEYLAAKKNIKILHFTTAGKPWTNPSLPLAHQFWDIARKTSFYEEILYNCITAAAVIKTKSAIKSVATKLNRPAKKKKRSFFKWLTAPFVKMWAYAETMEKTGFKSTVADMRKGK